ncbi:MAG: hypothetical protein FWC45_02610, partial [Treponema sp.]|nr:hypothetical protein [Treponema sp.]
YSSVFFAGVDREKPVLIKVLALLADGVEEEIPVEEIFPSAPGLSSPDSYSGWENGSRLCLVFSEPVDLGGVKNILLVEPLAALVMESPPEILDRAVFRFVEYPEWGSSFLFRLCPGVTDRAGNKSAGEYAFRITCSGPLSKAPALAGIRLPMAPGNGDDQMALHFTPEDLFGDLPITCEEGHYPYTVQTPSWVELYFDASAEIDLFSVMDLFRVEATNQALGFSPRSISADDFSIIPPEPGWENFRRVEIRGMLTNTVHSGIVTFRIPAGLKDKRGNRSSLDFRISLLK